ncbi:MAG: sensor histidine kinase [Flavisolibacter sp.]
MPLGHFNNLVGGITQDKNGYIWIASNGDGLYKYDGFHFQAYTSDYAGKNSLSTNSLETVYAGRDGILWILTYVNGVDKFDPASGRFTHFQHNASNPESLSSDTARAVLQDHDGTVWIGTNNGLDRYIPQSGAFKHYRHNPENPRSLSCNQVRKIYEDKEGTIWIGTGSVWLGEGGETDAGGLNRFDRNTQTFTSYLHNPANPQSLINNKVQAIFEDSWGTFWVGTAGDGLHTMDRKTGSFERHMYDPSRPEKLSRPPLNSWGLPDHITAIGEDATRYIWIVTSRNGINRYNPKTQKIVHFGNKDSVSGYSDNSGWCFFNSNDGILWLSTWEGNLYRVDPYQSGIKHVPLGAGVRAFCEDNDNNLWIGTTNGLVVQNISTGKTVKYLNVPSNAKSLSNNIVGALYKDKEGIIWVGTHNGVNRFNATSGTFTRFHYNKKDSGFVNSINEASNGRLWIGTGLKKDISSGLSILDKRAGTFTYFTHNPADSGSISRNFISSILVDQVQNVWVGTYLNGGLNYLDASTGRFRHFLKNINVLSMLKDSYGVLWVGTDQGLFQKGNAARGFVQFTDPGSKFEKMFVLSIQEDNSKNLWISTQLGVCKINLQTHQVNFFGVNYGVVDNLSQGSSYKDRNGNLYFGGLNGYYVLSPDKITGNPYPPSIAFTEFRLNGKYLLPEENGLPTSPLDSKSGLSLAYNQNIFSIGLAAFHFSSPENNRILYMLQNHDYDWRDAGSDRTASYFNVSPGHYVLRVKAASSDGLWTEKDLPIIIAPPWWRTWWAYALYALFLLAAIFFFDLFQRQRLIAKERERTKERELAQAKEIEKAYNELKRTQAQLMQHEKMASLGELTSGIAHEIQNPLNFINNFSEVNAELTDELKNDLLSGEVHTAITIAEQLKGNNFKISHHAKRADAIVKSMLQHSRKSTGQKEPTDINALVDEFLRLSYHGLRAKDKSFNATFETDFDTSIGKVNVIAQDLGRVLLNLFNNAFYSVNEKKKIQVNEDYQPTVQVLTKKADDKVIIKVRDNGMGIPEKVISKIYQPFFTTKPSGQGTGLGLSLSYDIITKVHAGELKVETNEGEGAEFIIILSSLDQS